jgi:N-acetylglutamate synthase-like GNAT family acetyltransferase
VGRTNLWVATRKERVIGFAGLIRSGKDGEIEPVIVTHNQRNTRVGQLLVETIETVARHEKLRELTVRPVARNTSAIRFFHSLGFNTLGHIQLIMDLRENRTVWKKGPKLFQKSFRY